MCNSILNQWVEDNRVEFTCVHLYSCSQESKSTLGACYTGTELVRESWSIPFWQRQTREKEKKMQEKEKKRQEKENKRQEKKKIRQEN